MSIIPGQEQTIEEKQAQEKVLIQQMLTNSVKSLSFETVQVFDKVWKNEAGLSPQQVFSAFGTDAGTLHSMLGTIQNLVNSVSPGSLDLVEPKVVHVNQDGSVTVAE